MLYCLGLILAAVAYAAGEDIKLGDKWVKFVPPRDVSESAAWTLTADPGSTIKVYCPDWRFSAYDVDEATCQSTTPLKGSVRVVFDDGVKRLSYCNSQSQILVNGQTSRMSIQLSVPPRCAGAIECMAKAIHPPKSYEDKSVTYGRGAISFVWPERENRRQEQEKAWRFKSDSSKNISMQCKVYLARPERNGICVSEIVTLDNGEGPIQRCNFYNFTTFGQEITLRVELIERNPSFVDCIVQAISGPSPNEYENIGPPPDDDSSEIGVVPGRKGTTCDCGRTNKQSSRIINGTEVTHESKFPFMVSMRSKGDSHYCGGSILSPVHILTAAHCVSDSSTKPQPSPSEMMPTVGAHSSRTDSSHGEQQRLKVKKVSIPNEWFKQNNSLEGDIAILHLETPIRFSKWVGPVCLTPEEPPIINQYIKAIGWGRMNVGDQLKSPDILREADVLVMDSALCHHDEKEICFRSGRTSSCNGDSGGPYIWADPETNRYTQVALVSYGEVGDSGNPFACDGARFAGTNTAYWYDWIQKTMAETSTEHTICRKRE